MGPARLRHVPPIGVDRMGAEADAAHDPSVLQLENLMELGRIAATPMIHWGSADADRYVRLVFSNETCERLAGIGIEVRRALCL